MSDWSNFPPSLPATPAPAAKAAPTEVFWGWLDIVMCGIFLCAALACLLAVAAGTLHFTGLPPEILQKNGLLMIGMQVMLYALSLTAFAIWFRGAHRRPVLASLGFVSVGHPLKWILAGVVMSVAIVIFANAIGAKEQENALTEMLKDPVTSIAFQLFGVLLAPFFEEFLFRGLLQPVLMKYMPPLLAIGLAALPFSLLHGDQYLWDWRYLLLLFLVGAVLGVTRWKSGSTLACLLQHAAYNFTFLLMWNASQHWGFPAP
jgi:uncharacterized protein